MSRKWIRRLIHSSAAAVALGATLLPTAAHAGVARVNGSVQGTLWSGYSVDFVNPDPQNWPLAVSGAWTVPAVSCLRGILLATGDTGVWVGLGGKYTGNDLEQIGTNSQCLGGTVHYWAFEQLLPSQPNAVGLDTTKYPVGPGDHMRAAVTEQGPGYFVLQLWNDTKHWYYPYIWQTTDPNALPLTADWIVEDANPLGIQQWFPKFTKNIIFNNCYWTQDNANNVLSRGNNLTQYTIIGQTPPYPTKEVTGPIATNGTSFYIHWTHW